MNLPNKITLSRICLIPIVMLFLLIDWNMGSLRIGEYSVTYNQIIAALIFILAASTDGIDGYIARKNKLVTNLGKLLDPLADKLLVCAVLVSLVQMNKLSALVAILIISREFAVTGLRQIALLDGTVVAASKWGKWKTTIQIVMIVVLLLDNFPFALVSFPFDTIVVWAAAIITVYSGIDYFVKNKALLSAK